MYTYLCLAGLLLVGVESLNSANGDVNLNRLAHNLTDVFETLTKLNHRVHQIEDFTQTQYYTPQQNRIHHQEELLKVLEELHFEKIQYLDFHGYMAPPVVSKEKVMDKETGTERAAYETSMWVMLRGSASGYKPKYVPNDMVLTHIAGGEVAIHMIHKDGHYEYAILGDVERNPRAHYAVVIPAHTYVADELLTEEYSLGNSVATPKYEESEYKTVDANELFTKFPQHKEIIKRAFMFGEHDTPTDLKSAVERAFQITETRQYNNQYPRQYGQYQTKYNQYPTQYNQHYNQYYNQYPTQYNQYPTQYDQYYNQYPTQYDQHFNQYPRQYDQYYNQYRRH